MAEQPQQQHPPTEQPPEWTQSSGDVGTRKAAAKEDLAFLTSGAKEKLDKTLAGMKGAAHVLTHPFSKEAKEEATAKTVQQKNEIGDKQERIRATAHMQLLQEKAAADGVDVGSGSGPVDQTPASTVGAQQPDNGAAAATGRDGNEDSRDREPENDTELSDGAGKENEISTSGNKISEDSSDGSSTGRARAQIPPDSQDYQSG